jgi:metal-sulfur cluster biosynthetic enzyme
MSRQEQVYDCLRRIHDPCSVASVSPMNLVEMGLIRQVRISDGGEVDVDMRLTAPSCFMVGFMSKETTRLVGELDWVTAVRLNPDEGLDWDPDLIAPEAQQRRHLALVSTGKVGCS